MTSRRRTARTRRPAGLALTAALTAALLSGPAARADDPAGAPSPAPPAPSAPPAAPAAAEQPAFGAYTGYDERGVARIPRLSTWLGGADLRVGHTYLPGDRWSNIEGAPAFLDAWAAWRTARADRLFVLNVPMLERNEARLPDAEVRRQLRLGAAGRFDHHFRALAERLVALNVPDTVLVLGWEMNGVTYSHRCGPDPEAWKAYWRRIVTAMRGVPGQRFRFDFTPSRGRDAVPWPECYPGDDTVDVIGMDAYDQPRGMPFEEQVREPYGLQYHVDFARAHKKPVSFPEWGLFRNGDNPAYMRGMLAWTDTHKPLYQTLTDYCPHGVWGCAANPRSAQVFRSALYGRTTGPAAGPVTPPAAVPTTVLPSAPAPGPVPPRTPASCSPPGLGAWIEYWIGGRLCLPLGWWPSAR